LKNKIKSSKLKVRFHLWIKNLKDFWLRYRRNKPAVVGLMIIITLVVIAIVAPFLPLRDPMAIDTRNGLQPPSLDHPFGTDLIGRDVLSRVIFGSRVSLLVGFLAGAVTLLVGTTIGVIAGYLGGIIDDVLMRITEIILIIPAFMLAILVVAIFGSNLTMIVAVIGLLHWPSSARIVRAQVLSLKEQEFIQSAKAIGCTGIHTVFRHLIPNIVSSIIILWSLMTSRAIIIEASLSFLGLGDPNFVTWGQMLLRALGYLRTAWWGAVFPGLAIFLTVISFNMAGEGLTEAFNPKLREL
jgi:peptide/nickel transport system permease protein